MIISYDSAYNIFMYSSCIAGLMPVINVRDDVCSVPFGRSFLRILDGSHNTTVSCQHQNRPEKCQSQNKKESGTKTTDTCNLLQNNLNPTAAC
jgi:hypothetical protein